MNTTTGPQALAKQISRRLPDGRWHHTIRQSTLSKLDDCPEQARLTALGLVDRRETDATAAGTAVHAGIEAGFRHLMATGDLLSLRKMQAVAVDVFNTLAADPSFTSVSYSADWCRTFIANAIAAFHASIYEAVWPDEIEWGFNDVVIHEDDKRVVALSGTIDLVADIGVVDWKTASSAQRYSAARGGEAWQLDRWAVQPTVYTLAAVNGGLLDPDAERWPFTYIAFPKQGQRAIQTHTVYRTAADHDWLRWKILSWCPLFEAELNVWPRMDNHVLCSPKWCPAWDACKGQSVGDAWPVKGHEWVPETIRVPDPGVVS